MKNDFTSLDAQDPMSALTKVGANEIFSPEMLAIEPRKRFCTIAEVDLGDEECRKLVYHVNNASGRCMFSSRARGQAIGWAKTNHFTISP